MPVETPTLFAQVIEDHLRLKSRNSALEDTLPLERYKAEDPFQNHPLFKTEEQARIEDTLDGNEPAVAVEGHALEWLGEDTVEHNFTEAEEDGETSLWGRSREFDWGD
jgi:hypothetical protein